MKKFILLLLFSIVSISVLAQSADWKEVQVIEIPKETPIYYRYTNSVNIKYYFKFNDLIVSVSKTNAEKFMNGTVQLELVKWRHRTSNKFRYTIRQVKANSKDIDLSTIFS